jgi:methyl-accepting chemotaxis protein
LIGSFFLLLFDWGFTRLQPVPPPFSRILAWRLAGFLVPLASLAFVRFGSRSPLLPVMVVAMSAVWTWANAAGFLALGLGGTAYQAVILLVAFVCLASFIPATRNQRLLAYSVLGVGQAVIDLAWPDGRPLLARAWTQGLLLAFVASTGLMLEAFAASRRRAFLLRRDLESSLADLQASRQHMAETAVTVAASAEQLGRSASTLVERAARSEKEGDSMADASRRLAQAAAALQSRSRESADTATQAANRASSIGGLIGQIETGLREIEAAVARSETTFEQLQARAAGIGALVESSRDVALQTHMLAVNAGIQSVSAGEHGKGFAVIAEEVRKLSQDSGRSAQEISGVVQAVERDMAAVLRAIGHVRHRTGQFSATFDEARATLEEIRATVQALGDAMGANAGDADAQALSSAGVSEGTDRMAALLRQQAEVAADVARTSAALAGHATGLRLLLSRADSAAQATQGEPARGAATRLDSWDT